MKSIAACLSLVLACSGIRTPCEAEPAGDREAELRLEAPRDWRGERIALPPQFAPALRFKGVEVIRFAPGMFKADSDSFFSYVLVFRIEPQPELTKEVLHREILTYYRGLAAAVLKGTKVAVEPRSFTLKLSSSTPSGDAKRPQGLRSFAGELSWVEPFVTRRPQTLSLDIETWRAGKHNYLFMTASPKSRSAPIWKSMATIRAAFYRAIR